MASLRLRHSLNVSAAMNAGVVAKCEARDVAVDSRLLHPEPVIAPVRFGALFKRSEQHFSCDGQRLRSLDVIS